MTTGSEKNRSVSRLVRPLGWTLLVLVCTAIGACNLNPRPEPPGATNGDNGMMMGGNSGGKSGSTGPETPGRDNTGGDQSNQHPGAQDAGAIIGPGEDLSDGGAGEAGQIDGSDAAPADAADGAVDSDAVTVQ